MNKLSKSLLLACLVTFGVGMYVSSTHTPLALIWTLALPISAVLYGLFLITFVFQGEFGLVGRGEQSGTKSDEHLTTPRSETESRDDATNASHRPAYG
jgi:hypothetical protein